MKEEPQAVKLSIILPVYQVENYIEDCLDSILNQSFKEFELIIIDDGSFDRSPQIVDKYAGMDHRIRVVHQKNGGISKARNEGLEMATGRYATFVDSDDCIHPDMYAQILRCMEIDQVDVGECGYKKFWDARELGNESGDGKLGFLNSNSEIFEEFLDGSNEFLRGVVWNKVYKRTLFEEPEKLRFKEGSKTEDGEIILKIMDRCEKFIFVNRDFYHYRQRNDNNITANRGRDLGLRKDAVDTLLTQVEIITKKGYKPEEMKRFLWRISKVMINSYYVVKKDLKNKEEARRIFLKIRPVIKMAGNTKLGCFKKILLNLFCVSPELFWFTAGKWYKLYYLSHVE